MDDLIESLKEQCKEKSLKIFDTIKNNCELLEENCNKIDWEQKLCFQVQMAKIKYLTVYRTYMCSLSMMRAS